jgi:DHA1 family inner membrane transport protein
MPALTHQAAWACQNSETKCSRLRGCEIESSSFTRSQVSAAVAIAVVASCVPALQPILLGKLLAVGRIDAATLGYAATAEGLGMAIATAIASAVLPPRRLRLIGTFAILAVLAANATTAVVPGAWIIAARCLSGLGNGVLLWLLVGMLARSAAPTRLFAIYITANASLVFLLTLLLGSSLLNSLGVTGGYVALIGLYLPLLLVVHLIPGGYTDLGGGEAAGGSIPWLGLAALAAVVLYLAGVMGFWIYSVPLGNQVGISTPSMQSMLSAATGVQIVAGFLAVALAARISGLQAVTITSATGIVALLAMTMSGSASVWLPCLLVFSFCWMFGPPFHIAFLNTADPSRRSAMYVGTAQLVGYAVGPLLSSAVVSSSDYAPAQTVSIACFAAVVAIAGLVWMRSSVRRAE